MNKRLSLCQSPSGVILSRVTVHMHLHQSVCTALIAMVFLAVATDTRVHSQDVGKSPAADGPEISRRKAVEPDDKIADPDSQQNNLESQQAIQNRVAVLIKQLGSPSYRTREKAEWALQDLGLAAYEQLSAAVRNPQTPIEIASAAEYLIQSQNVTWYLDSDSIEVRSFLTDYDALSETNRVTRVKALAAHATSDAILALCRLVRYERHEHVSKEAALSLIEYFTNTPQVPEGLMHSVAETLGSGDRRAVQWIHQVVDDIKELETSSDSETPQLDSANLAAWKEFAEHEINLPLPNGRRQASIQRKLVLDFVTRSCAWLNHCGAKDASIDLVRPTIEFLLDRPQQLASYVTTILDDWHVPEMVVELARENETLFQEDAELGYLLAEAHRQGGDEAAANAQAKLTSDRIANPPEKVQALLKRNGGRSREMIASIRAQLAATLTLRSNFDWAENEYQRAIRDLTVEDEDASEKEQESNPQEARLQLQRQRYEWSIRENFAEFYWFGGQNQRAADVLEPLVDAIEDRLRKEAEDDENEAQPKKRSYQLIQQEESDRRVQAAYHFYQGLAHTDAAENEKARESLKKSLELNPTNPDIIIAMRNVADTPQYRALYEEKFDAMRETFRSLVVQEEEMHSRATRNQQRQLENNLAHYCNQLAWLLGKCESNPQEAIRLSERSLKLSPEQPAYLDTLARCYFSAGEFEKAVETQRQAVKLAPYERMMAAQLNEFEMALSKHRASQE